MIETIYAQLSAWGRWIHNPIKIAVGYPRHSAGFGDYRPHGVEYKSRPPEGVFCGSEAMDDIDRAVRDLCESDRALCIEYYAIGPRWDAVCARMAMSKSVLYRELHRIQDRIYTRMFEGIDDR